MYEWLYIYTYIYIGYSNTQIYKYNMGRVNFEIIMAVWLYLMIVI